MHKACALLQAYLDMQSGFQGNANVQDAVAEIHQMLMLTSLRH